jgi:hypothetical protein
MVALPCTLFQVTIGLDYFFVISIVDNMASQNSKDWEFLLAHVSDYPIQLSQPSTSRRRVRQWSGDFKASYSTAFRLRSTTTSIDKLETFATRRKSFSNYIEGWSYAY